MKKVLFMIDTLEGGGAEKVFYDIVRNLDREKYELDIFLLENKGIYKEKLEKLGFKINYLFKKNQYGRVMMKLIKSIYILFPNLIPIIKKNNYDVQVGFLEGNTTVIAANTKKKVRKIAWVHINLEKTRKLNTIEQRINSFIERRAYRKIDKIVCVAKDTKEAFLKLYPELEFKTEVIYNLIDKEEIIKKANEKKIILDSNKINIITIGRLVKQKGYDILLEIHNELLKDGMDYNLYIIGEGIEREKLESFIKDNKIEKNTFLLGFQENPYIYLKQADIFVSSSRNEGFSLVVAEALCLGKPIIATRCAGPRELLDDGKYGVLISNSKKNEFKEKLKELIIDENLRTKLSVLANKRAETFRKEKVIEKINKLIDN